VHIKPDPMRTRIARKMWGEELAASALRARGVKGTPLALMEQILALHDAAQAPTFQAFVAASVDVSSGGGDLRAFALTYPLHHLATAYSLTEEDVMQQAFGVSPARTRELRRAALDNDRATIQRATKDLQVPAGESARAITVDELCWTMGWPTPTTVGWALPASTVRAIKWMHERGVRQARICEALKLKQSTVSDILSGRRQAAA
jgi:hypothetical protein